MDFLCACASEQSHYPCARRSAHYRVIYHYHAFPGYRACHRVQLYPYRVAAFGCEPMSVPIGDWTPELLAKCPLVVLPETNTQPFYRKSAQDWKPFRKMLSDYVANGGSVLFLVHTAWEVNNYANLLQTVTHDFGIAKRWESPRAARHAGFGDPGQIIGEAVSGSPLTEGVRNVQLYRMCTLGLKGDAKPVDLNHNSHFIIQKDIVRRHLDAGNVIHRLSLVSL